MQPHEGEKRVSVQSKLAHALHMSGLKRKKRISPFSAFRKKKEAQPRQGREKRRKGKLGVKWRLLTKLISANVLRKKGSHD